MGTKPVSPRSRHVHVHTRTSFTDKHVLGICGALRCCSQTCPRRWSRAQERGSVQSLSAGPPSPMTCHAHFSLFPGKISDAKACCAPHCHPRTCVNQGVILAKLCPPPKSVPVPPLFISRKFPKMVREHLPPLFAFFPSPCAAAATTTATTSLENKTRY